MMNSCEHVWDDINPRPRNQGAENPEEVAGENMTTASGGLTIAWQEWGGDYV